MSLRQWYRDIVKKKSIDANNTVLPKTYQPSALLPVPYAYPEQNQIGKAQVIQNNGIPVGQTDALSISGAMRFYHPSSAGQPIISNTAKSLPSGVVPARGPRVKFHDPLSLVYATGFKDRRFSLTYDTLRRTSYQLSLLNAIILTRVNQVSAFAKPYRKSRQIGFEIKFKDERYVPTEAERLAIARLEQFIMDCGWEPNPYAPPRDDFEIFLKKFVRDSLTYDQGCHPAGTMIELPGCWMPIEEVQEGQLVLTHEGRLRRVTELKRRMYTGDMIRLRARGQEVEMTGNHPLLVCKDKWAYLGKKPIQEPEWVEARDVKEGMYLTYPVPELKEDESRACLTPLGKLDEDMSRLLGLFVADGHVSQAAVIFTFGLHEMDLVSFVKRVVERCGWGVVVEEDKYGCAAVSVRCNTGSTEAASWFPMMCGKGSHNKYVPTMMYTAQRKHRQAFLAGYLEGDGSFKPSGAKFNTVSQVLFVGLRTLFAAEGIYCAENKIKEGGLAGSGWSDQYQANISGKAYRDFARSTGLPCVEPENPREPYLFDGKYFYLRVNAAERWDVEDFPVFNFEIEEDHSYIANGFCSHNCFEIVPDEDGRPFEFRAVDAATIRLAATYDGYRGKDSRKFKVGKEFSEHWIKEYGEGFEFDGESVFTVQVMHGRIENIFTHNDMAFCIRNARSDVWVNGYGFSETEMCLNSVLRMLWAEEYNCLTADTKIETSTGLIPVSLLTDQEFDVWDGYEYVKARAFPTHFKSVMRTKLCNGLEIKSSPEHKFFVIPRDSLTGRAEWRTQQELMEGDVALVGYRRIDPPLRLERLYVGENYMASPIDTWVVSEAAIKDSVFWEFLGLAMGDGHWPSLQGLDKSLRVFLTASLNHSTKQKFKDLCVVYGITSAVSISCNDNVDEILEITSQSFIEWLYDIGFKSNINGKRIPKILFELPAYIREAFLRGLLSSSTYQLPTSLAPTTVFINASDTALRQDLLQCCWSVGVAVNEVETSIRGKWSHVLSIQDLDAFVDRVGFLHFTPVVNGFSLGWDVIHPALGKHLIQLCKEKEHWGDLAERERQLLQDIECGEIQLDRSYAINLCHQFSITPLEELCYVQIPISWTDHEPVGWELMYDVEVFNDRHLFLANNIAVHNSRIFRQGSMANGIINFKGENFDPSQLECVPEDTLVPTDKGVFEIGCLQRLEKQGHSFRFWNGHEYAPGFTTFVGPKSLKQITLTNGFKLRATPNHRVFVFTDNSVQERFVSDLKIGDVVLQNDTAIVTDKAPLKDAIVCRTPQTLNLQDSFHSDLWGILGWFVGSGWSSSYSEQIVLRYSVTTAMDVLREHQQLLSLHNLPFDISITTGEDFMFLRITSQSFIQLLKVLGVDFGSCTGIPWGVYTQPLRSRQSFVRNLFLANNYTTGASIALLHVKTEHIAHQIQQLLNTLGVSSYQVSIPQESVYQVVVSHVALFDGLVGFTPPTSHPLNKPSRIPLELLISLLEPYRELLQGSMDGQTPITVGVSEILSNIRSAEQDWDKVDWAQFFRERGDTDAARLVSYAYVPIAEIVDGGFEDTYDVTIKEGYSPRFIANGILTHNSFRRIWQAHVTGVENCLAGDVQLWTKEEGAVTIHDALGDLEERRMTLWTGKEWAEGILYRTKEPKQLCKTVLSNGVEIKTSGNHKFLAIGLSGSPEWKEQKDLLEGDFVLVNKKPLFPNHELPSCNGKVITSDLYPSNVIMCSSTECPFQRLLTFLDAAQIDYPSWLRDYYFASVVKLEKTDEYVNMFDVEMFTEEHQFVANGIITHNSHRTPIVQIPEGIEFVSMQRGNKEMEFRAWLDYLLKIVSGTYQIDPSEINFDLVGGSSARGAPLFESKHEWKLKHSRDKGLRPLLEHVAKSLNHYVLDPLDSRLYLDFIGLDKITESDRVEMCVRKASSFMTLNEVRKGEGLNPVPGGDIILNPIYLQSVQLPPNVLGGARVGANPLSPWLTEGEDTPPSYGDAVAVPLYMQEGGEEELSTFQAESAQPGMPPGGMPPGMPPRNASWGRTRPRSYASWWYASWRYASWYGIILLFIIECSLVG